MSKLFKLKKWLSIEDTCKRLSITLEEEVNVKDLIQLIIEGDLRVSWYFQVHDGMEAVEVIKDNVYVLDSLKGEEFLSTTSPLKYITNAKSNIAEGEFFRVYIDNEIHWQETGIYRDYRVSSPAFDIEGVFNIHVNTGDMKTFFENILFETEAGLESKFFEGIIVEDQEERLFKLVNPYLDEDTKHEDNISNWSQPPYPLKHEPKLSDLVILRSDLESFEQNLLESEQPSKLRTPADSLTIALGVMTEILSNKTKAINKNKKLNYSQLSTEIEQQAAKLGLDLNRISNLQKDLSKAHKIITNKST